MSGYNEISSWMEGLIEQYESYEEWLEACEQSFIDNGRSPLNEIFDQADYSRLEREYSYLWEEPEPSKIELQPLDWDFQPLDYLEYSFEPFVADFFNWIDSL